MSLFGKKPSKQNEESKESPPRGGGGLFGNQQAQPSGGGLFANTDAKESPSRGGGLFGGNQQTQPPATGGNGGSNTGGGGLFANTGAKESPPRSGGGLFGGNQQAQPSGGDLFANTGAKESPPRSGGGLFGGLFGGLLGGNQQAQPSGGGLFANTGDKESPPRSGGGLFGNKQAQPPATGGGLFGNKQAQSPTGGNGGSGTGGGGLFGGPSGNGGTGGGLFSGQRPEGKFQPGYQPPEKLSSVEFGKGTLGKKVTFVKNKENITLASITCTYGYGSEKGKTLEEWRAEDYELMKSGELPEDIQAKLNKRREYFGLPAPTRGDPKVFKSYTKNGGSMKSLFLSNKYSDVIFKVGDESIPAHRNVLGPSSQHFDDLFSKHESNTLPLVIEIPDAQPEAFKAILESLYCGEITLYEELAADLLILAPRFDLKDLAAGAEDFLTHVINADNYLKMLETSERLGSKSLRKKVWTFVIKNMKVISKREDFEELPRPLLMELLENAITGSLFL